MATTFPSNPAFNNVFSHLSKNAGFEDIAAMALVGAASAAYMFKGTLWDKPDPYLYKWFERPQELMGGRAGAQQTRNIAEKLEETGADMIIFWGSQSGTAQRMANRLAKECHQRFGVKALSVDASDYSRSRSRSRSAIEGVKYSTPYTLTNVICKETTRANNDNP